MTQAFLEIVEPPLGAAEPLQALAACNDRLLHHCTTLRRLVLYLGECGFDAQAEAATGRLFHFFDRVLLQHHADEAQDLFPALIESMAGSDAVCLHEITGALAQEHRELDRLWLRLRPALEDVATRRSGSLPVHDVESFVERCQACVAREVGELLPMAARLLADAQLAQIGAGMRERRAGPT